MNYNTIRKGDFYKIHGKDGRGHTVRITSRNKNGGNGKKHSYGMFTGVDPFGREHTFGSKRIIKRASATRIPDALEGKEAAAAPANDNGGTFVPQYSVLAMYEKAPAMLTILERLTRGWGQDATTHYSDLGHALDEARVLVKQLRREDMPREDCPF